MFRLIIEYLSVTKMEEIDNRPITIVFVGKLEVEKHCIMHNNISNQIKKIVLQHRGKIFNKNDTL